MIRLSLLLIFQLSVLGNLVLAQTSPIPYQPTAIEQATWVVFDDEGFYSPYGFSSSYVVRITGDSTVADIAYKKVYVSNLIHPISGFIRPSDVTPPYQLDSFVFHGLIRDDELARSVYGRIPFEDGVVSNDTLIHDYGAEIGDTLNGLFQFGYSTVEDVYTEEYFGEQRLIQQSSSSRIFIEGIGTGQHGPFGHDPLFLNVGFRALLSYCIGTEEECELELLNSVRPVVREAAFKLFPNPARSAFTVEFGNGAAPWTKIRIYDAMGRLLRQEAIFHNQSIPIADLASGLYYVQLIGDTEVSALERLLKL